MAPIIGIVRLTKLKMQTDPTKSASENRHLNTQLKQSFDAMNANADFISFITSLELGQAFWTHFGKSGRRMGQMRIQCSPGKGLR